MVIVIDSSVIMLQISSGINGNREWDSSSAIVFLKYAFTLSKPLNDSFAILICLLREKCDNSNRPAALLTLCFG